MKLEKFQIYLFVILIFLFVGCGGEPDKYTIKMEPEKESTEWNLTFLGSGQDSTPSLKKGTMVLDFPSSAEGVRVTLHPADSKECFKFTGINETTGQSQSMRGCGPFVTITGKPDEEYRIMALHKEGRL